MKHNFRNAMVLVTVILMELLAGMEFDLFVPSFPELQSHFNLTPFWVQASLSINFLGYCLSLFFVGGLGDRYGPKPIILLGLVTFLIGSVLCLWGGTYPVLLMGRFLQGLGVAAPAILAFLIIADNYTLKQQQFLMAMMNGLFNGAAAFAPVIGSYITLYFHWQGNFMTLLLFGVTAFLLTVIFIPPKPLSEHKETLSLGGYVAIFKSKPLLLLMLHFTCMFVPYWIFVGMSPLLYLEDLGVILKNFGYYQGSLALVCALGSFLYGSIIHKIDQWKMLIFAGGIWIASMVMITSVLNSTNALFITLAFIPFIVGQLFPSTTLYPLCLNIMPAAKGKISALIQAGRLILAGVSVQIAGYYYVGSFKNIGIIINVFILLSVVTLFLVIRNREIREFSEPKP